MYKLYFFLLIVATMSFCSQQGKKYYLKGKWRTSSDGMFSLKHQPKKITENFYTHVDSISQETFPIPGSRDEYLFNAAGDIIQRNFFYGTTTTKAIYTYTVKGYTLEMVTTGKAVPTEKRITRFEADKNGKFLESNDDEIHKKTKWYEYKNNGAEILTEEHFENSKVGGIIKIHFFYKDDYLLKKITTKEQEGKKQVWEDVYYYSKENVLDSVVVQSGTKTETRIFIKNKFGHPVIQYDLYRNRDTLHYKTFDYTYDNKGNWIKCFEQERDNWRKPGYGNTLLVRKIEY